MRGPQVLLAHALLERVDDRAAGVVEGVVGEAREHQVEWLDLVAHERVRPVELLLELGLSLEVPRHCRLLLSRTAASNACLSRAADA